MSLERAQAPNPYDFLPSVPEFTLTSTDLVPDDRLDLAHVYPGAGGDNVSPHLQWTGFPQGTRSFAVTVFDPDAPTGSGWWHWQVINIGTEVTELPRGAGDPDGKSLPPGAVQMRNDYGEPGFGGAGPPPGDVGHRYFFVVHALDTDHLDLGPDTTPAVVGFHLTAHALARATLVNTYSH